jgi:von Willebrand factor type A domain
VLAPLAVAAVLVAIVGAATTESRFALVRTVDVDGTPVQGLTTDDFVIEDGGASCDVIAVTPASYPVALVVDTSSFARTDFQQLRDAVHQFVGALSDRDVALYVSGTPPARLVDFTKDLGQIEGAIDRTFAQPDSSSRILDAIDRAARNLPDRHPSVTRIVVLSAGGPDASGRSARDVVQAIAASRSIVDVIDLQQTREYAAPSGRERRLRVGIRLPGVVVQGVAVERPPSP